MMRRRLRRVATVPSAVLLAASLAPSALAQTPARRSRSRGAPPQASQPRSRVGQGAEQSPQPGGAEAQPDLSITARVTARELRFERVPNPKVEFTGRPRRETVWESERENLPKQVRPGVTYRDIGITLRITSVFADIDRIVAEALGEVPPSDDAQPRQTTPPEQPNTPPARREDDAPPVRPGDDAPPARQVSPAPQTGAQAAPTSAPTPAKAHANVRTAPRRRPARGGRGR